MPNRAQTEARIRLAINGEYLVWSCGRANPRQPGSSPRPTKSRMKRKRSGSSRSFSIEKPDTCPTRAKQPMMAAARKQVSTGVANPTTYHLTAKRQRMRRLKNSCRPDRPETLAAIIIPAINGPRGFGPLVRPRISAIIHGYHESANASTKNATNLCRCRKAFTRLLSCWRDALG